MQENCMVWRWGRTFCINVDTYFQGCNVGKDQQEKVYQFTWNYILLKSTTLIEHITQKKAIVAYFDFVKKESYIYSIG